MEKIKKFLIFMIISFILVIIDQYTKILAINNLKGKESFKIIKNVLELVYTENTGAAFGILRGKQIFFYIITVLILAAILYLVYKTKFNFHFLAFHTSLLLVFSGAIGNFIDRVKNQYVVDFIYFVPIDFPVFNFADMCITVGCIILFLSIFTIYKNDNLI